MGFKDLFLGIGEKLTSFVPGAGPVISNAIGMYKDFQAGADLEKKFSAFAEDLNGVKDGLNKANEKIEAQGKALQGQIDGVKSELEGAIQQQGEKFDQEIKDLNKNIAQATGQMKKDLQKERDERKNAMAQQKQELESKIKEVTEQLTQAQEALKQELDDFKNEVNERFAQQEKKILENKRKIEEEKRQREAEIREVKDKISVANTKISNLQQEKDELQADFQKNQFQTNQKLTETQQELEDTQAEFQSQIKVQEAKYQQDLEEAKEEWELNNNKLESQINDNQELLEEFEEDLAETKYQQKKHNIQISEITEELQETNDILHAQQRKLNLVSQQMEDIQEEVHNQMEHLSQKLDERTQQTLNVAKDATKKVDKLAQEVKNIHQELDNLEDQIKQNKEETEKVKKETKLTNERLDHLIKAQSLSDYSEQESKIDKIQKSLELKAEEAKLLATLNLLKETKQLIRLEVQDREWKVGIKTGTETQLKGQEGFTLKPGSSWTKKYTPEQLQEWGWDTRLLGEHETAHLTSEDKKESQVEQVQSKEQEGEEEASATEQAQQALEEVNKVQSQVLKQLQEIQAQINQELTQAEEQPIITKTKPSAAYQFKVISAQSKVELKKKRLEQQKREQKEAEIKAKTQPTKKTQQLAQQAQQETKQAEQEVQQAESELKTLERQQDFEETLEKVEDQIAEDQKEQLEEQWQQVQALSQQALETQQDLEKPEETKEEELDKKLEEIVQQVQEQEVAQAASKKSMTKFMLFLIIFLLEYVVYKKNGVAGLILLNVILAILYYQKDTIMEYQDLWEKYFLIIGYVIGNVMAYNSVENPNSKWPMVIGYNAVIGLIYGYTYWERLGGKQLAEKTYQQQIDKLREEFQINEEEWQKVQAMSQPPKENSWMGQVKSTVSQSDYNIYSDTSTQIKVQQLENLKTVIQQKEEAQRQEEYLKKQAETLEQAEKINQQLEQARNNLSERMTWDKIYTKYPDFKDKSVFLKDLEKADRYLQQELENKVETKHLLTRLSKIPVPSTEELDLLSQLNLTLEQFIALSCQAQYLTRGEKELIMTNYSALNTTQKLQLVNSGLNNLEINTYEKKQAFVQLTYTLDLEKANFGLTTSEKENILRLLITSLDLSTEQRTSLENMGIRFFDASNWEVSEEQKNSLLGFGCSKITLTEEQEENLLNTEQLRTFSLTEQQKTILQSLAPLIREDKYSVESLQLLRSLNLKPNTLTFLVNEEILPNPNLDFGETKSPYLPLKIKLLEGEQKVLEHKKQEQEKQTRQEEVAESKKSIVLSLAEFAEETKEEEEELNTLNYSLSDWVKLGAIKAWQKDILLTLGLKTVPKYNFFELLIFAVENILPPQFQESDKTLEEVQQIEEYKTQILTIIDAWKDNSSGQLKEELRKIIKSLSNDNLPQSQQWAELEKLLSKYPSSNVKLNNLVKAWKVRENKPTFLSPWTSFCQSVPQLAGDYQQYLELQKNQPITINKKLWAKFVSSQSPQQKEVLNNLNLEELINQQIDKRLSNYQPLEVVSQEWLDISLAFTKELVQAWEKQGFDAETCKEWIDIGLTPHDAEFADWLVEEANLTPEEVLNNSNITELREQFTEWTNQQEPEEPIIKTSSRYDSLLSNLNTQENERQKKKLEREEARKKLEAEELKRRQTKLSEKDRKLKEDAEKRQKEKELAEQEEQKREESRLAREKTLKEEQETFLTNQQKILEDKQKSREEAFTNQQKQAELAETKKKADIEALEQQNKFAQQQLEKQKELLEKETQEKLAQIATHDQKERQRILKQQKDREADLETRRREDERLLEDAKSKKKTELDDLERENKKKLAKKRQELTDMERQTKIDLARIEEEKKLAEKEKELDQDREKKRKTEFKKGQVHQKAWKELLDYSLGRDEMDQGVRVDGEKIDYKFLRSQSKGGFINMPTLERVWQEYPTAKIKLVGVENLKHKLCGDRAMTYDDVKYVARLANRFEGQFFSKDEWKEKIESLAETFFTDEEID